MYLWIIRASRGSGVRRAVRSPLSGSRRLSAAITTTAQVTSLNIRPLGGRRGGYFYVFILTGLLGRYFAWVILGRGVWKGGRVIRAILGLAKSHGSALPPWRLPGSTNSMMEYQMHKDKDKDKDKDTNTNTSISSLEISQSDPRPDGILSNVIDINEH